MCPQKRPPGWAACLDPYASQQFTLPADPCGAKRRLKGPTDTEGGGDVGGRAGGGGVNGEVQECVGREPVIDFEAEASLVRGGRDAGGRQGAHRGASGGEAGACVVEAVNPLRSEEQRRAGDGDVFRGDAKAAFLRGVFLRAEAGRERATGLGVGVGGRTGGGVRDEGRRRETTRELLGWAVEAEAGTGGF